MYGVDDNVLGFLVTGTFCLRGGWVDGKSSDIPGLLPKTEDWWTKKVG